MTPQHQRYIMALLVFCIMVFSQLEIFGYELLSSPLFYILNAFIIAFGFNHYVAKESHP